MTYARELLLQRAEGTLSSVEALNSTAISRVVHAIIDGQPLLISGVDEPTVIMYILIWLCKRGARVGEGTDSSMGWLLHSAFHHVLLPFAFCSLSPVCSSMLSIAVCCHVHLDVICVKRGEAHINYSRSAPLTSQKTGQIRVSKQQIYTSSAIKMKLQGDRRTGRKEGRDTLLWLQPTGDVAVKILRSESK